MNTASAQASPGGFSHEPVMLEEVLSGLAIKPDGRYVDCTFGRGGHTRAMLARMDEHGRVLALDRDPAAYEHGRELMDLDGRLTVVQADFARLSDVVADWGESGQVDGLLLDLGLSSPQLDEAGRGFSLQNDGPLDMRMDPAAGVSAAQWLAEASATEIETVLREFGEERFARRIARALVEVRAEAPVETTARLTEVVLAALPAAARRERKRHPATRVFQAIRIQVNGELDQLKSVLPQVRVVLKLAGRVAVISFHSLEDRMVKRAFRERTGAPIPRGLPVRGDQSDGDVWRRIGKATRPGAAEVARNPRARSAILRIAERVH